MREIKFRAWDKKEKVMCRVKVINLEKGAFLVGNSATPMQVYDKMMVGGIKEGHFVDFDGIELMQFTGLKDKNGKEIYEGDVIKVYQGSAAAKEMNWIVTFRDGAFGFQKNISAERYLSFDLFKDQCDENIGDRRIEQFIKIIGNIYENPELKDKPQ